MNQQQQYAQPQQPQYAPPAPQQQQPVQSVFDTTESEVSAGGGLDLVHNTYQVVVWGVMSYKGYGIMNKANEILDKKLIVVQFPTELDEQGYPKVGWVYANNAFGAKSNLHKYFQQIFGRTIGKEDPIRLPNGNLDPRKITGTNCFAVVGNIATKDGDERTGIMNFSKLMDGMAVHAVANIPEPDYIKELKAGKELVKNTTAPQTPPPAAPVPPAPVAQQYVPPVAQQPAPVVQQPVQQPVPQHQQPQQPVQQQFAPPPPVQQQVPQQQPAPVAQQPQQQQTPPPAGQTQNMMTATSIL